MRIPAKELEIVFVSNFYDHPLAGICEINGETWWFERVYLSRWATIRHMGNMERLAKWWDRTLFGICVGWHWHYTNGKRMQYFSNRGPQWFWEALMRLYYCRITKQSMR